MSPLDAPATSLAELPMLRPLGGKLTPRLPPCEGPEASPRHRSTTAYPEDVRSPAAPFNLTPRPPAEGPETGLRRRRYAAPVEERKAPSPSTSLPPVPLTARESRRQEDLGGSGSSMASARSKTVNSKERRRPPMPKAPSPKDEVSSRASSSQGGRPSSGAAAPMWDLDLGPELFELETVGSFQGFAENELLSDEQVCEENGEQETQLFSAELGRAPGRPEPLEPRDGPSLSCVQVLEEMEREKELWNEKTLALLSSPNLSTAPGSTSSTAQTAVMGDPAPVRDPEDHAGAPADVPEELQEEEPQPSLIAQAMRDAGLDEISLTDLANGREGQAPRSESWRLSSKSWAAQRARRKKVRCNSGRGTPCGPETPERRDSLAGDTG